jgi:3-(methylthio)propionyl---CoA ligase
MLGLMMERPLLISSMIEYAATYHGKSEIVSRTVEGGIHRYGWADAHARAKQLANALQRLGIRPGDRVATLAWNTHRHLELYYGISGMGAICHTINPRLAPEQLRYIINHAEDALLFVDLTFVPIVEALMAELKTVRHVVVMTDEASMPAQTSLRAPLCYETLLAGESPSFEWPLFDENTASSLCYTSGTTGNPKGALFSHRSTMLHAYFMCMADFVAIARLDSVCPVVPMFHVNAWGIPYAVAMTGAKLVFPGPKLDGASLHELFEAEGVTINLGVPTVWLGLLKYLDETGKRFSSLQRTLCGGSAMPETMIRALEERYDVRVTHGWGMTEMSPVGTVSALLPELRALPKEAQYAFQAKQGRPMFNVELKIVDEDGSALPHDGVSRGELLVRGPWVIREYYKDEAASRVAFDNEGWFRTGDIATIDEYGFMQIVDRQKDLIKSGGEWISSIDIENIAIAHPDIAEAAAIGVPHPRWGERPLLVVVPKPGRHPSRTDILSLIAERVAKWQVPDDVLFLEELPHTATGKILKRSLRDRFVDFKWPAA